MTGDTEEVPETRRRGGLCRLACSNRCKIYLEQALSSWGDRMWHFAVGLYLVMLSPSSLRLTAIYGFTSCISLIIFGAPIGKWIDHTPRLNAARISLMLQNTFVGICAGLLCFAIHFNDDITGIYVDLMHWAIISVAVLSDLASAACRISIGKDWIVVIARDPKDLGYVNAMVRRIDLTSLICAPIVTGQIMTYLSMIIAAVVIASWNVVSMFLEYYILSNLYHNVPELGQKKGRRESIVATIETVSSYDLETIHRTTATPGSVDDSGTTQNFFDSYVRSWKLYFKQDIVFAGIGLSFLYMTVLGFDSITQGYANQQGVSASILGGLSALGAVVGILGTLAYPRLRDHIGIERTGLYGFMLEVACLSLCVVSIWMPGSPFDPTVWCYGKSSVDSQDSLLTTLPNEVTVHPTITSGSRRFQRDIVELHNYLGDRSYFVSMNESQSLPLVLPVTKENTYTSIAVLMSGIVTARFGLWMADLTVNQLLQEEVSESHRGTVSGVQHSLNMTMNMFKFVLVICFPCLETFGYLIIVSFIFICLGWIFYCCYSYKKRGHVLPWHKRKVSHESIPGTRDSTTYL